MDNAVEGTQVERLQKGLKEMAKERDHFEKIANFYREENEKLWKWVKQDDEPLSKEEEKEISHWLYLKTYK